MRRRYKTHINRSGAMTLNITSMTDMFTILLVFLLQNFAASQVEIEPLANLRLPASISDKNPVDGVKIGISQNELLIDKIKIADLKDKHFNPSDLDQNDSNFIPALFNHLQTLNKNNPKIAESGKALLQADKDLDYDTLRKVLYTSSMAGFPNVKLVVQMGTK